MKKERKKKLKNNSAKNVNIKYKRIMNMTS